MNPQQQRTEFEIDDLEITQIIVYTDRAELKRQILVKLNEGFTRVLIKNIVASIVEDSIRVEGEGRTRATFDGWQFDKENLTIAIDLKNEGQLGEEVKIVLKYQVESAYWTPSYDVWMELDQQQEQQYKKQIKLKYFAKITQQSGEDWENVKLVLSTTKPGDNATNQMLAPSFTIPNAKTIRGCDVKHMLTIAVLNLDCLVHFDCMPSKDTNVYLSAACINSSEYTLLNGPIVYLNNHFTQKIQLENVAPGEKFQVPFGVYPHLKVAYKPAIESTKMFSSFSVLSHEQNIIVQNIHPTSQSLLLTILEPIPKVADEKTKIRILAPNTVDDDSSGTLEQLNSPLIGAKINKDNNMEWTILARGKSEKQLTIKWEADEKLEIKLKHNNFMNLEDEE